MNQKTNPVVYFEIPVLDMERAVKFYSEVFKFEFYKEVIDNNEMSMFPFEQSHSGISGALAKGESYKPTTDGIMIYFGVNNIEFVLDAAVKNGGKVFYPMTSIGELGFVAEFIDCEGNRIALHSKEMQG